jgi:hypothetical protein
MDNENLWPSLPFGECKDTMETLHMKMQVVGKVKLGLTPFLNQWWNVAFYLNTSGMTTGLIPYNDIIFEINFDFTTHELTIRTSENRVKLIDLAAATVADFYREFMNSLNEFGISVTIDPTPAEVPNPIRCDEDTRSTYEKDHVYRWWKILLGTNMVLEKFRSSFRGKSSPVLFYWGSFDLAHSRFSGKTAEHPKQGGIIMKYAENEENFAVGFWHGYMKYQKPAFYSYIYPSAKGIENAKIKPGAASYKPELGLFILDYDVVRTSEKPAERILDFLNSTYEESAKLAGWDIESLKAQIPG